LFAQLGSDAADACRGKLAVNFDHVVRGHREGGVVGADVEEGGLDANSRVLVDDDPGVGVRAVHDNISGAERSHSDRLTIGVDGEGISGEARGIVRSFRRSRRVVGGRRHVAGGRRRPHHYRRRRWWRRGCAGALKGRGLHLDHRVGRFEEQRVLTLIVPNVACDVAVEGHVDPE